MYIYGNSLVAAPELKVQSDETPPSQFVLVFPLLESDRLCGLVVRVLGYRSGGPGSIPGTTRKKK
jgi:hypothetical protein